MFHYFTLFCDIDNTLFFHCILEKVGQIIILDAKVVKRPISSYYVTNSGYLNVQHIL